MVRTFNGSIIIIDSTIDTKQASSHFTANAFPNSCPYSMMITMENAASRKHKVYARYTQQWGNKYLLGWLEIHGITWAIDPESEIEEVTFVLPLSTPHFFVLYI